MRDIDYPDAPENWDWDGGEGSRSHSPEGYYVHWFHSDKFNLEGSVDSPMDQNRHVIQIRKQGEEYNEYVENIEVEIDSIYHYLKGKQKAWNKAVKVMRKINEGDMLQDVVS